LYRIQVQIAVHEQHIAVVSTDDSYPRSLNFDFRCGRSKKTTEFSLRHHYPFIARRLQVWLQSNRGAWAYASVAMPSERLSIGEGTIASRPQPVAGTARFGFPDGLPANAHDTLLRRTD